MIGAASAIGLLLSIGLLCVRRIDAASALCAMQALIVAAALGEVAAAAAVLAFALNAVALPLVISRTGGEPMLRLRANPALAWSVVVVALLLTLAVFLQAGPDEPVAIGASVVVLGLVLIGLRSHAHAPALGLLSSQNGLVLVASAIPNLTLPAALAAAVPFAAALALAESWLRR